MSTIDIYNLGKLVPKENICVQQEFSTSKQVFESISKIINKNNPQIQFEELICLFSKREKLGSTCIGHGIAIPHLRIDNIEKPSGAIIQLKKGINFTQQDDQEVDIFFGFVVPSGENELHLEILAAIAEKFSNNKKRDELRQAITPTDIFNIITE